MEEFQSCFCRLCAFWNSSVTIRVDDIVGGNPLTEVMPCEPTDHPTHNSIHSMVICAVGHSGADIDSSFRMKIDFSYPLEEPLIKTRLTGISEGSMNGLQEFFPDLRVTDIMPQDQSSTEVLVVQLRIFVAGPTGWYSDQLNPRSFAKEISRRNMIPGEHLKTPTIYALAAFLFPHCLLTQYHHLGPYDLPLFFNCGTN